MLLWNHEPQLHCILLYIADLKTCRLNIKWHLNRAEADSYFPLVEDEQGLRTSHRRSPTFQNEGMRHYLQQLHKMMQNVKWSGEWKCASLAGRMPSSAKKSWDPARMRSTSCQRPSGYRPTDFDQSYIPPFLHVSFVPAGSLRWMASVAWWGLRHGSTMRVLISAWNTVVLGPLAKATPMPAQNAISGPKVCEVQDGEEKMQWSSQEFTTDEIWMQWPSLCIANRCELGQELAVQLRLKADFKEAGERVWLQGIHLSSGSAIPRCNVAICIICDLGRTENQTCVVYAELK